MKTSFVLLGLTVLHGASCNILKRTSCNADNCLRGIRGTDPGIPQPLSSRLADCSSFMKTTVTPAPSTTTITTTQTITVAGPAKREIAERQVTIVLSSVPAYATYCPASSAYSSACSCVGVTATTTTAPTPVVTTYATATATVTVNPCPGKTSCSSGCVDLTSDNDNCGACGNKCGDGLVCGQSTCVLPSIYSCTTIGAACGGSCGGFCFQDVSGAGWCKVSLACAGLQTCATGADCPSTVCLVNGCGHVCAGTQYLCPNTVAPKFLFQKREAGEKRGSELEGRKIVQTEIGPQEVDN